MRCPEVWKQVEFELTQRKDWGELGKRQMNKIEIICKEAVIEGYFNAVVLMASYFLRGKCVTN